ncbi:MAG TPA: divalent-cation tolerance protein CutA [Spirochaetes bacterium]|nr:divalent-cation tolerance protein CutA [Spirochaetota bacterium]
MSIQDERDYCVIYCTSPTKETALTLSDRLVSLKLAACVNIIDTISSIYRWKGEICRETEFLMVIKSRKSLIEHIEREIREHHPYEVPEIIALSLAWGHDPYLRWIDENTM